MHVERARNWLLATGLAVSALAVCGLGAFGWLYSARVFEALSWRDLDPLWPFYAVAIIGCGAAQIVAACAAVNFTRVRGWWRALAFAFYASAVVFSAFSADHGAQVILGAAQRATYESRETERKTLTAEIAALAKSIETERRRMPAAGSVGPKTMEAATVAFQAATAVAESRLPIAQSELTTKPPIQRDLPPSQIGGVVFAAFLLWGALEPWGFALVERGRTIAPGTPVATRPRRALWWRRAIAAIGLGGLATGATQPALAETPRDQTVAQPNPVTLNAAMDEKAIAFSMRGRFTPDEIARKIGRDRSTVYRWFKKRDAQAA